MNATLKDRLKEKIEEKGISIKSLEKNAGLKRSAISNILLGKSLNPRYKLIQAIASALDCTTEDLLNPETKPNSLVGRSSQNHNLSWNPELFSEISDIFNKECILHDKDPENFNSAISLIEEAYIFCSSSDEKQKNQEYIKWLVQKYI